MNSAAPIEFKNADNGESQRILLTNLRVDHAYWKKKRAEFDDAPNGSLRIRPRKPVLFSKDGSVKRSEPMDLLDIEKKICDIAASIAVVDARVTEAR